MTSTGTKQRKRSPKKLLNTDSQTERKRCKVRKDETKLNGQLKLPNGRESSVYVSPTGERVPFSVRIDSGIKKAWMQFLLDKGLSSCEIVEKTFLGIMAGYQAPVYASHTINVIVDFPRVVKRVRRRQLYYEDEVEVVDGAYVALDAQPMISCVFCSHAAVDTAECRSDGKKVFVCERHKEELRVHPKWRV